MFDSAQNNLMRYLKYLSYPIVFIIISCATAGSHVTFFRAVETDTPATIEALLQRGFDPNTMAPPELAGLSPLAVALRDNSPKVAALLLEHPDVDVNFTSPNGETPLMMAALRGRYDAARRLVERGAAVNRAGWTPLHYAATGGHLDVVELLFEHHAFVDPQAPETAATPLMMAARFGTEAVVERLLEEGADIRMTDKRGATAVDYARSSGRDFLADKLQAHLTRARR